MYYPYPTIMLVSEILDIAKFPQISEFSSGLSITYVPLSSSKIRIPIDHRSTDMSWPLFRIISGATYSGVPQNVHVLESPIFFAKPKSVLIRD